MDFKKLVVEYRRLVQTEASTAALEAALDLLERVARVHLGTPLEIDTALQALEDEDQADSQRLARFSEYLAEFMRSEIEMRRVARRLRRQELRSRRLLFRAAVAMVVPDYYRVKVPDVEQRIFSLLIDVVHVVFHQAYFTLLGDAGRPLAADQKMLVHRFIEFARFLRDSAEASQIRALCFEALGEPVLAEEFLEDVVNKTPPDAHEFMTVLQTAWSQLMERDRRWHAMLLLFSQAKRVRERDLTEFHELLILTADEQRVAA